MTIFFKTTDGDVRSGWKAAILIVGASLIGIILNSMLITALVSWYASQGLAREQAMEQASMASGSFIAQSAMSVLQLIFILWLVRWLVVKIEKQTFDWSKLGLIHTDRSRHILTGILLAFVPGLLTVGIGYIAGTLDYLGSGFKLFSPLQVLITLSMGAILSLASGFGEEIAFRGYLQSRIARRYNPAAAVVITAVLFAISHPVANTPNPLFYLATATLVGVLFGVVFVRTGSLWIGISLHAMWNYLQIAIVAVRNSADERFSGAPLLAFESVSGTTQMSIEFFVILIGLLVLSTVIPGRSEEHVGGLAN